MDVSRETLEWLTEEDMPAVAVLARELLEGSSRESDPLWGRRNEYEPVAKILDAMRADGTWADPERDYQKYGGNLWQIVFLGELWADPSDERIGRAAEYAFSRQIDGGAWGSKPIPSAAAPCLTANVGRSLARLGFERDERIAGALAWIVENHRELGVLGCRDISVMNLNGYCHMLAPKILLFLAQVPRDVWPRGAVKLRDECVRVLRDKYVFRCLPTQYKRYTEAVWPVSAKERAAARERFIRDNSPIEYKEKPVWTRFGFPLSYNSDALEALLALAAVGEPRRRAYEDALSLVRDAADDSGRWVLRNSLNGKMIADVEAKGKPSKWLTLRALQVLAHFDAEKGSQAA
jgi:hypothetical protein